MLRIPKLVSGATVTFVGEGGQIPDDADVDFDEVALMPTERKSIKTILRFTNELVRQSVIGIDAVLRARLVKDVSDALDDALLKGDGVSDSITGIIIKTMSPPETSTRPTVFAWLPATTSACCIRRRWRCSVAAVDDRRHRAGCPVPGPGR